MTESLTSDLIYMKEVNRLARRGAGSTSPNPMVGALVVKNGEVLGRGYHRKFGGPHAEVYALKEAGGKSKGATLYINLEPCVHFGNTPPCADRVIEAGISKVVLSNRDPNPLVNGAGVRKLREAGIKVKLSVGEKQGAVLNEAYFTYVVRKRPFVTLKWAQSLDGRIATQSNKSQWITNEKSRKIVHKIRSEADAILVGAGTVNYDDPELTVRYVKGKQPWRLIVTRKLSVNPESRLFNDVFAPKTVIFTLEKNGKKRKIFQDKGITVKIMDPDSDGYINLAHILSWMWEKQLISLLVEGGKELLTFFLSAGLADKLMVFIAPKLFGHGLDAIGDLAISSMKDVIKPEQPKFHKVGSDILFEAYLKKNPCLQD